MIKCIHDAGDFDAFADTVQLYFVAAKAIRWFDVWWNFWQDSVIIPYKKSLEEEP